MERRSNTGTQFGFSAPLNTDSDPPLSIVKVFFFFVFFFNSFSAVVVGRNRIGIEPQHEYIKCRFKYNDNNNNNNNNVHANMSRLSFSIAVNFHKFLA